LDLGEFLLEIDPSVGVGLVEESGALEGGLGCLGGVVVYFCIGWDGDWFVEGEEGFGGVGLEFEHVVPAVAPGFEVTRELYGRQSIS
jgi:hypothetical protein